MVLANNFDTGDATSLFNKLREAGFYFISKGLIDLQIKNGKQTKAFIVRDNDGHALLIKEETK